MTDAPLKPFAASYRCDGRRWAVTLYATSFSDAERRLALMAYGRVDGEIVAAIDMPFWRRTFSQLRRLFR